MNELVYFMDLTGNPYISKHKAAMDMYFHAAKDIRAVNPNAIIGGIYTEGPYTEEVEAFLEDERYRYDGGLLNYVTYHNYTSDDCSKNTPEFKKLLLQYGYGTQTPIYINEWNITPQWKQMRKSFIPTNH